MGADKTKQMAISNWQIAKPVYREEYKKQVFGNWYLAASS
jgi:hypothetical protein